MIVSAPIVAYWINSFVKILAQRPRPPMELQIAVHPHSFSYVSRHSFVTFVFFTLVIYYLNKYCTNKYLKIAGENLCSELAFALGKDKSEIKQMIVDRITV